MDKTWMYRSRLSDAYQKGVDMFLNFAFTNASYEDKIICPCIKCGLTLPVTQSVAYDHLVCDGFTKGYTKWVLHGEASSIATTSLNTHMLNRPQLNIDTHGLVHETFGISNDDDRVDGDNPEDLGDKPNPQAEKFYKLINDRQKELYPQCRNFTKLSFILRLFHIKNLGRWSNNSFTMLLELLKEAFPEGVTLPNTVYKVEQIVMELGLSYEKIHACPNDCMLYRNEHKTDYECYVCHISRYVTNQNDSSNEASSKKGSYKTPSKVLHYFSLIPRLQGSFMSSKTALSMKWHKEGRTNDGCMRHPADSPAWMTFDRLHPDFTADYRNVRLGLACDGVNPFRTLSSTYSTWPVILIPYNLPPWMCMKQTNFLLSLIILDCSAPENNIDVYLQPLIDELKELWVDEVETYDASIKQNFQLCAALMWTISDFPAYAYLSRWSTKGSMHALHTTKTHASSG
ncbi:uncharacterized protein LOC114260562 [Camellia sinensis]|uniref:uncharacterized protein LOC114260562 n=1 Tax=Camellia sinensis TaxID=4442 RepID=UPI0010367BFE|nr:uncharacterized protein LOC114260562 [Camellia sinensis]